MNVGGGVFGFAVRGVLLDAGRRYWQPAYLHAFVERIAALGYNRLQLHLTEWNGFRVVLPGYEYLASDQAYTVSELARLIEAGAALGVEIVPELNLPAHTTWIIEKHPDLRFPAGHVLNDGSRWTGSPTPSWLLDFTRAENREWAKGLLAAFCTAIPSRRVHFGADECPPETPVAELNAFVDELACVVRDCGKQPEIWGDERIRPALDVTITCWEADQDVALKYAALGYRVISSPSELMYVTPRTAPGNRAAVNYVVGDPREIYERWEPARGDGLAGYQLCVWADWAEDQDDEYFDWYSDRPLAVLAERLADRPRRESVDVFLTEFDSSPGCRLTPVRSANELVDLGRARRIRAVRFRPALPERPIAVAGKWPPAVWQALEAVRGTGFQGAAEPDGPWHDLAVARRQPANTWSILNVADGARYRWLRAASAPAGLSVQWKIEDD